MSRSGIANSVALAILVSVTSFAFGEDLVISGCAIEVIDEISIPAQRDGVLMELPVREGSRVKAGDLLAHVDDREAQAQLRIAEYGLNAARQRAEDTIEERYATKASEVAKVDWEKDVEAERRRPNSVADIEIRQKKLAWERAELQIEKAQKDRELAALDADTKLAERDAAVVNLEKRTITAPFDGEVVQLNRKQSEWVNPGEPILTLASFDKLYVEGFVSSYEFNRSELRNRPVTVVFPRARGNEVTVKGKVVFVAQQLDGVDYRVRAEIENIMEGDDWLIQPSNLTQTQMTIHLE